MSGGGDYLMTLRPGDSIYIAARFERQTEARSLAHELMKHGYKITSRWLCSTGLASNNPASARMWARMDLVDVSHADVYLLLSDDVLGRGGKDFEGGYAYARGKRVVVVGPPAHVFHWLPNVTRIDSVEDLRVRCLGGERIDS